MSVNQTLLALAHQRVRPMEKTAVVPAGGDPAAAAGGMPPGGAPPMDPAMAGGAPPMDPAMAGGAPMGPGAPPPPMDPMMAQAGMMAPMPGDPAAAGAGQKMKPEQMMQMLDFRLYNMQQQLTAIMNHAGIEVPAGALVTPPGSPTPVAEAAVPGGPQDPSQQPAAGGGGQSAIGAIEPIQGASPELAAGGGGAEKIGSVLDGVPYHRVMNPGDAIPEHADFLKEANANAPGGWNVMLVKAGSMESTDVDSEPPPKKSSPPNQALNVAGAPGTRPATQAISAGGSKDPLSKVDGEKDDSAEKTSAQRFAENLADEPVEHAPSYIGNPYTSESPVNNAAATAALFRSRTMART